MDAVKSIDFGGAVGSPRMSEEKNWMLPDESLPEALPKPKVVLSLMPYKTNTRFNWDPVYQKKIRVDKNTWRGDPFYELLTSSLRHPKRQDGQTMASMTDVRVSAS